MKRNNICERFWSRVDASGECWEWQGALSKHGYGVTSVRDSQVKTHRLAWMLAFGHIPDGAWVLHSCDNRKCVRLSHLRLGTSADNVNDMVSRGRNCRGARHHKSRLTEDQVFLIRELCRSGQSHRAVAVQFGVSKTAVGFIVRRRNWKHAA